MYCGIFMLLWDIFQLHHNHKNIHFSFENVLNPDRSCELLN